MALTRNFRDGPSLWKWGVFDKINDPLTKKKLFLTMWFLMYLIHLGISTHWFFTGTPVCTLLHNFSASQPSWFAKDEQDITLQLWQNSFLFLRSIFENFEPKICFFIYQRWDEISQMTVVSKVYIKQNFKFDQNEIVLPPKHGYAWSNRYSNTFVQSEPRTLWYYILVIYSFAQILEPS